MKACTGILPLDDSIESPRINYLLALALLQHRVTPAWQPSPSRQLGPGLVEVEAGCMSPLARGARTCKGQMRLPRAPMHNYQNHAVCSKLRRTTSFMSHQTAKSNEIRSGL